MISRHSAIALVFVVFGALGVWRMQPALASTVHSVKARDDVYALPPPRELKAMTFGYHAAAVDMIWAKLLVEYGMHWGEHRDFLELDNYLDAILEIEPDYAPLYKYVSTLLVYRPLRGYEKDSRRARAILERGTRERPDDWQVWLDYGEFVAYLGPSWMETEAERQQWRHDGAIAIARAVDLGAASDRSLDVAATLKKFGERDAAIRELERGYALTEDPAKQAQIAASLAKLEAAGQRDEIDRKRRVLEGDWRASYPFTSRGQYLMLGPIVDPLKCAGPAEARGGAPDDPACAHDWPTRLAPPAR